ncbi:hypothetical protein lerEdw1_013774 [Lerista edwardsae]|nr:hypothetical protein lerEdw1_013774 [Lerista edwardsae]
MQKLQRAPSDKEGFFDLLSKFQSNRMDDQRCPLEEEEEEAQQEEAEDTASESEAATPVPAPEERLSQSSSMASPQTEALFDLIASSQSRRLNDQRASMGSLPGLRITHNNLGHLRMEGDSQEPGDEFFNMLVKCQGAPHPFTEPPGPAAAPPPTTDGHSELPVLMNGILGATHLEAAASQSSGVSLSHTHTHAKQAGPPASTTSAAPRPTPPPRGGPTVPDEDFFSLIQRVQAKRMDEQRVDLASAQEEEEEEPGEEEQQPDRQQGTSAS